MGERILFIPDTWVSPRGCELIPGYKTMLDDWRELFEVEIVAWPWMRGHHRSDYSAEDNLLQHYDPQSAHVVAAPVGSWLAVVYFERNRRPLSFTSIGFFPPPATLKASGLGSDLSDAALSLFTGGTGSSQYLRLSMPDSDPEEVFKIARELDRDMELDEGTDQGVAGFRELDLTRRQPLTSFPVLYLKLLGDPMAEVLDRYEIFKALFPETECEQLHLFTDYARPEGGREVSRKVIDFIKRVAHEPR